MTNQSKGLKSLSPQKISNSVAMHPPESSGVSRDRQCCPVQSDEPKNLINNAISVDGAPRV